MKQKVLNSSDISQAPYNKQQNQDFKHLHQIVSEEKEKLGNKKTKGRNSKKKNLTSKQRNIIFAIIALLLILAYPSYLIVNAFTADPTPPSQIINLINPYLEPKQNPYSLGSYNNHILLPDPSEPKTKENPINGVLMTESDYAEKIQRLPVAVMVNNHAIARPQSSITQADIVYETIAESGITRYMPIFWENGVNQVGPIRSARQYYIEWLSPYDAIYIHDGYAMSDDPRTNAGGSLYAYNIKDLSTYGVWREYDGRRYAPHNEYSSVVKAWERAAQLEWGGFPEDFKPWSFKKDESVSQRGSVTQATIVFDTKMTQNGGQYDVTWDYDETLNAYLRSVAGKADVDQENNQRVTAKTVIIQLTNMIRSGDYKGHLIFDVIGKGESVILMDGKRIDGTWEKASRTTQTRYYDENGKEIEFNRGQIWVEGVPKSAGKFAIIGE